MIKKYIVFVLAAGIVIFLLGDMLLRTYTEYRKTTRETEVSKETDDKGADRSVEDEIDLENDLGDVEVETADKGIDTSDVSSEYLKKLHIKRSDFNKKIDTFANENGIRSLKKVYSYKEIYDENGEVTVPLYFKISGEEKMEKGDSDPGKINFDFVYQKESDSYMCRIW